MNDKHNNIIRNINNWIDSEKRNLMLTGQRYYLNDTDIKNKTVPLANRSNVKLEHGFVRKLVDQKTGYLLAKPPTISSDDEDYNKILNKTFDRLFLRIFKNLGKDAINKGIAWLQVYIDEEGKLCFKRIPADEIVPIWYDLEHTKLNAIIRRYEVIEYLEEESKIITKVEYWDYEGVNYYSYDSGKLEEDKDRLKNSHFKIGNKPYNWNKIPFIPFKYNDEEQPLIGLIKSLVDEYNYQASVNSDILRDLPNLIYLLKDLGGTDLEEFKPNLSKYGVASIPGDGKIEVIRTDPNTTATESIIDQMRKNILEFGRGVDFSNINIGNATGVGLKFRYSDLDMDCNIIETEFQASFQDVIWFVSSYNSIIGNGDFSNIEARITFNRDIIINESDAIKDVENSVGVLSDITILENHPWVKDYLLEISRLEEQRKREYQSEDYGAGGINAN